MTDIEKTTSLPEEILDAELKVIRERRAAAGIDEERSALCGLAISGGGIRSSTFSIGVIQELADKGLFKEFDYMSTVSGGGYTGALLSSLLTDDQSTPDRFPLHKPLGEEEPQALQHIRNGSNYLAPGGFLSVARLPAVMLRGLLLNFLLLIPMAMAAVLLTEFLHENLPEINLIAALSANYSLMVASWVFAIGGFYLSLTGWRSFNGNWRQRNSYELKIAAGFLLIVVMLLFGPTLIVIDKAIYEPWLQFRELLAERFPVLLWGLVASLLVSVVVILRVPRNVRSLINKLLLFVAAMVGPALVFIVYLLMVVAQVDSPFINLGREIDSVPPGQLTLATLDLSRDDREAFMAKGIDFGPAERQSLRVPVAFCGDGSWLLSHPGYPNNEITLADCNVPPRALERQSDAYGFLRMQPRPSWPKNLSADGAEPFYKIFGARLTLGGSRSDTAMLDDSVFAALTLALFVLNYLFINVNQTSLHGFYRDRLSKTYLIKNAGDNKVAQNDEIRLSELNCKGSYAPYQIVNTALNLQGAAVESQRGRSSDFFFLSKLFCGGTQTGYCPTEQLEQRDPHLDLGTAMAISGAAAAPNMGSITVRSLVFILTLLNVRLGYWLPNPAWLATGRRTGRPRGLYLAREALGSLTAKTGLVNISDGGHLENLAIYELLRRRCSTILCIDGEADPEHGFQGLITLIRIAAIDLGVVIEIDLNELQLHEGMVQKHYAAGKIIYGPGVEGVLIYVKSSYGEDTNSNPFLHKYRSENPQFPHESTSDQFFDECQFEAYRALGQSIGRSLVHDIEQQRMPWEFADESL